jgi:D-alanyl-D-alanine carboxypeptidase (penicillin-binding protein 5/6)
VAGEAPGRKKQHQASGETGGRVAADPRLAVFRTPGEVRKVRVTEDVGEEHVGAAAGGPAAPGGALPPRAPETAENPSSAARPQPPAGSTAGPDADTPDDVSTVDTLTDPAAHATAPAPRTAEGTAPKTEPNRDQADGAGELPEANGARDTDEEAADSGSRGNSATGSAAPPTESVPESEESAEESDAADGSGESGEPESSSAEDGPAPERTPLAEEGARTADVQQGENPATDADPDAAPDDGPGADAAEAAEPAGSGKPGKPEAPEGEAPAGSEPGSRSASAAAKRPKDAAHQDAAPAPAAPAPPVKPVIKPLVSDLPEERPGGVQDGQSGRLTAFRGPMGFGTPGTPTKAGTAPQAPAQPAVPPLPAGAPARLPAAAPGRVPAGASAPLPPAAKPSAKQDTGPGSTLEGEAVGPEGTRSMPVPLAPEQAPLKLLAELTNTPPPRQTALRTVGRRFKIWTPLVVLLAIVFVIAQAVRPLPSPALDLTAADAYTFNGTPLPQSMPWPSEGQSAVEVEGLGSLGVHGAPRPVPIASVTKVMTAYVILHDHPLSGKANGPTITVDAQAAQEAGSDEQSTAPVTKGQQFTERQMLQLLLIPSGNNIARLLARWDSGTQASFVAKMTKTAASLGMTHTTYTGASGIEETTVSTAQDQLMLAREVMKNSVFRSVVALPNATLPGVGRIFNNNNDLVNLGVVGIKTGSSTPAGGALMWAAHKTVLGKEQLILGVTLQQHGGTTVADSLKTALDRSQALIESVQGGLDSATIVKKGEVVGKVDDGLGGSTPVVADKDLTAIGWPGMKSGLVLTPVSGGVPHSAKAGTEVGTLSFGAGAARTTVPVVLQSGLNAPSFGTKLTRVS